MKHTPGWISLLALLGACSAAQAELVDTGNGLVNHVDANITWVADANLFVTEAAANPDLVADVIRVWNATVADPYAPWPYEDVLDASEFSTSSGYMTYHAALAWIHYLNAQVYKGYSNWRIPAIDPVPAGCFERLCREGERDYEFDDAEFFRLFYQELGGSESSELIDTHNANFDLFTNVGTGSLWIYGEPINPDYITTTVGTFRVVNWEFYPVVDTRGRVWPVRTGLSSATPPLLGQFVLDKHELIFDGLTVGTVSAAQEIEIRSTGTGPAELAFTVSSEFSVTHDCTLLLEPGSTCVAAVTYAPVTLGGIEGSLVISAGGGDRVVSLSGASNMFDSLVADPATLTAGAPATLSWTALPATATCIAFNGEAGDGWTGSIPSTGSRSVTRSTPGTQSYSIRCIQGGRAFDADVEVTYTLPAVTLTASSTSATQGEPHTLTWTSTHADSCTASGNGTLGAWSGTKPLAGSAAVAETTLGPITYTLTCTSSPQSVQASVQVFVNARPATPAPPSSGGGSLGLESLLALLGLLALREQVSRRPNSHKPGR
jgi:hypothetical protein